MILNIKKGDFRIVAIIFFSLLTGICGLYAQEYTINPDQTVQFRHKDSTAKSVKLYFDCKMGKNGPNVKVESYHAVKMKKDSDGVWSYTTPPMVPEVYTYQYEANGKRFPDPSNPDSIRVRREKMSVMILNNTPQSDLYVCNPMRGKMDTLVFKSPYEPKPRRIIVYTPPQYYENTQKKFPVLYLLHGLNGNETAWNDRGRASQSLDNLIAQGKAKPMIMVMPDANPIGLIEQKEEIGLFKNILLFPSWNDMDFEKRYPEIDSFLMERYRFKTCPGSRAVAGLSAGAKQSANLVNLYDSTFSAVGMFSPVVGSKQLPQHTFSKYWIGGGTSDFFHHRINKFRKKLQRKKIPYTMYNTVGGHTWRNWRVYFTEFVQDIFWRNNSSDK
jgi:enterochelin esterase family protein